MEVAANLRWRVLLVFLDNIECLCFCLCCRLDLEEAHINQPESLIAFILMCIENLLQNKNSENSTWLSGMICTHADHRITLTRVWWAMVNCCLAQPWIFIIRSHPFAIYIASNINLQCNPVLRTSTSFGDMLHGCLTFVQNSKKHGTFTYTANHVAWGLLNAFSDM